MIMNEKKVIDGSIVARSSFEGNGKAMFKFTVRTTDGDTETVLGLYSLLHNGDRKGYGVFMSDISGCQLVRVSLVRGTKYPNTWWIDKIEVLGDLQAYIEKCIYICNLDRVIDTYKAKAKAETRCYVSGIVLGLYERKIRYYNSKLNAICFLRLDVDIDLVVGNVFTMWGNYMQDDVYVLPSTVNYMDVKGYDFKVSKVKKEGSTSRRNVISLYLQFLTGNRGFTDDLINEVTIIK